MDSDHLPLQLELESEEEEERRKSLNKEEEEEEGNGMKQEGKWYISWTEEDRERYKEHTKSGLGEGNDKEEVKIEELWDKIKTKTKEMVIRKEKKIWKMDLGHKEWWNKEYTRKKRKVKRSYRKWRNKKINREIYLKERREIKKLFEEKQEERRRKMEDELKGLNNETEVWRYINKRRNKREGI